MARFFVETNAITGAVTSRPFTAEEEAAADRPPARVTRRQFRMQLEDDGLLDGVEAWVGQQSRRVQIAYESSGTFVRDEPMMQAGFAALGFQTAQIDAFFKAAFAL